MKKAWINELLSFSRKERSGIIILLSIIFLFVVVGRVIPLFISSEQPDIAAWESEVKNWLEKNGKNHPESIPINLVAFDPNSVDSAGLVTMGVPEKVASNWARYLKKGGRFRDKEGVKKIYGMTPRLFEQLDSFLIFGAKNSDRDRKPSPLPFARAASVVNRDTVLRPNYHQSAKPLITIVELNGADSLQLVGLKGIGAVLAHRILRYRNLLGGYYSVSQLKEVYGMSRENLESLAPYLAVIPSAVKVFNINFSTFQELGHHPYVGYKTAGLVVKLRDKNGKFTAAEDLMPVIRGDSLARLVPYLKFSE